MEKVIATILPILVGIGLIAIVYLSTYQYKKNSYGAALLLVIGIEFIILGLMVGCNAIYSIN